MRVIPFADLYYTEFIVGEVLAKPQNWFERKNIYSCFGKPKPSHTLLWFKNCRGRITCKDGTVINVEKNQLAYMAKTLEYMVSGTPVLSSRLDGIPKEYENYIFYFDENSAENLGVHIRKILDYSPEELAEKGK